MAENVNVGGIADQRSSDNQVGDGSYAPGGPGGMREIVVHEREREIPQPGKQDLPPGGGKARPSGLPLLREHRSQGPAQRGAKQGERIPQLFFPELSRSAQSW